MKKERLVLDIRSVLLSDHWVPWMFTFVSRHVSAGLSDLV